MGRPSTGAGAWARGMFLTNVSAHVYIVDTTVNNWQMQGNPKMIGGNLHALISRLHRPSMSRLPDGKPPALLVVSTLKTGPSKDRVVCTGCCPSRQQVHHKKWTVSGVRRLQQLPPPPFSHFETQA